MINVVYASLQQMALSFTALSLKDVQFLHIQNIDYEQKYIKIFPLKKVKGSWNILLQPQVLSGCRYKHPPVRGRGGGQEHLYSLRGEKQGKISQ